MSFFNGSSQSWSDRYQNEEFETFLPKHDAVSSATSLDEEKFYDHRYIHNDPPFSDGQASDRIEDASNWKNWKHDIKERHHRTEAGTSYESYRKDER